MRKPKPLTTQAELDSQLLNYCLLPEGKRAESFKRVELFGRSNIFVSVSARKHFPIYLLFSGCLFNLGCYSSKELETNTELQLKKFANKTYLTYQDLVFFAQEIKKLKSEWGNLSRDEVIKYHASLPNKNVVIHIEQVRDIFIRCAKYPTHYLGTQKKSSQKFLLTQEQIEKPQEPPKRPQFVEVKKNEEEVKLSEKVLDQEVKFEEEPLSSKEINEQIEDLEVQMKLLNIEKQQIVLQQKINKLKRA